MGEGLLMLYSNFQFKKTFENMYEAKNSEKNEIFSIFNNFGGKITIITCDTKVMEFAQSKNQDCCLLDSNTHGN